MADELAEVLVSKMLARDLVSIISINIKSRTDHYSDQFNRILIVKVLMACSIIMGFNWFKDSINCINNSDMGGGFVSAACWIQGVYIYEELKSRVDEVAFYGMPKDMDMDGMLENGELCNTNPRNFNSYNKKKEHCTPLTKTFFLQYQWLPFYLAALAIIYYLPYICHMYGNSDMISLKKSTKSGEATPEKVVQTYFNRATNPVKFHRFRIIFGYIIKILYIVVNLIALYGTDSLLYGKFIGYGPAWVKWSRSANHVQHDYMGTRNYPKPGHEVLPPFGYCEVVSSSRDETKSHANNYKFACELSQNILSQYALILLWFVLIGGLIVSILGLVAMLVDHLITFVFMSFHGNMARKIYGRLTMRECEYLEFIRRRNIPFYSEVLQQVREVRLGCRMESGLKPGSLPCDSPPPGFEEATKLNMNTHM